LERTRGGIRRTTTHDTPIMSRVL